MFNNLTRIVDIVKEEAQKIINLDTSMIAVYNNFHLIDNKEEALQEYIDMLEMRKDTAEIEQVQAFLSDMITALNKHKVGMIDNYTHKKRIKSMKAQCANDMKVETVEDENEIKPIVEVIEKESKESKESKNEVITAIVEAVETKPTETTTKKKQV